MFHWILLTNLRIQKKILHSKKHIANNDKNITHILDKDGLLDVFIHIANISKTRMGELDTKSLTTFER
jgi:cold shock CspA family protein